MYIFVLTYNTDNYAILVLHILYFRLLTEEDEVRIYHSLENTRLYHEIEPTFIQISSEVSFTEGKIIVLVTNFFSHHLFLIHDLQQDWGAEIYLLKFSYLCPCVQVYLTIRLMKRMTCNTLVNDLKMFTRSLSFCYWNLSGKSLVC